MKGLFWIYTLTIIVIFSTLNSGCKKDASLPNISTTSISGLTDSTVSSGGFISEDGGATITARGVCWDTAANPNFNKFKTSNGTGIGTFVSSVTGLISNTTYYIRAFATNSAGTAYGADIKFTTTSAVPIVKTINISTIASIFAYSEGTIISEGIDTVIKSGACWSTDRLPTILNYKSVDGTRAGSFTSSLTGLTANTTYYVRAYATNRIGTGYGNELSFKTGITITDYDGNEYNTVIIGTQVWMLENLKTTHYNNGDLIGTTGSSTLNISSEINPKYQWAYNGDDNNVAVYGRLYSWYSFTDSRGICPIGWHAPNYNEFVKLFMLIGSGDDHQFTAGGPMKEAGTNHWLSPNTGATNSCGFTALPGGYRNEDGVYVNMGKAALFWMSGIPVNNYGYSYALGYNIGMVGNGGENKIMGLSVRCLKD